MKLIILSILAATSLASPLSQSLSVNNDGSYQFSYETGKDGGSHSRSERRGPDGVVVGKYSYEDPTGELREVSYRADNLGYVAKGDVGVEGAPKGQFPAEIPEEPQEKAELQTEDPQQNETEESAPSDQEVTEEDDQDNFNDFPLEENVEDRPPEAFPPGFFLEKFQGLRRFPEPTKENKPVTTEVPPEKEDGDEKTQEQVGDQKAESAAEDQSSGVKSFIAPKSFPSFAHQEWASAMFHQPVYVYSYKQPDSFGYHYFF